MCISLFALLWTALLGTSIEEKQSYLHVNMARNKMMIAKLQSISDKTSLCHRTVGEKKKIQDNIASAAAIRDPRLVNRKLLNKHDNNIII